MTKGKIREKEMKEIIGILDEYKIAYQEIAKVRSAYKVIGHNHSYCLKKLKHGKSKSKMGEAIVNHLKAKGFSYVVNYIKTTDGQLYIKKENSTYYMTDWVEGREANFKRIEDLIKGIELLAQFHKASMEFIDYDTIVIKDEFIKSKKEYFNDKEKLINYKEAMMPFANEKKWEKKYIEHMDYFMGKAMDSLRLFDKYNYDMLIDRDKKTQGFCHQSYYYQNVVVDENENYYIIDLDSCGRNIYIYDLGKFLRRTLWAVGYKWNFDVVQKCIEAYGKIKTLDREELGILLGIIIFPHKYIKLGTKRMEKKEGWDEEKYHKKLKKQIEYIPYIEKFIKDYEDYYGIHIPSR